MTDEKKEGKKEEKEERESGGGGDGDEKGQRDEQVRGMRLWWQSWYDILNELVACE